MQAKYISGRDKLIVIKVGAGGTLAGFQDKYKSIATAIQRRYNYAVLIVENPLKINIEENFKLTMDIVMAHLNETMMEVCYIGVSKGAALGAMYAWQYPCIKQMLLINPPLMVNWHRIEKGLEQFKRGIVHVVIGELDTSGRYAGLIECLHNNNVQLTVAAGCDHVFTDKFNLFEELCTSFVEAERRVTDGK